MDRALLRTGLIALGAMLPASVRAQAPISEEPASAPVAVAPASRVPTLSAAQRRAWENNHRLSRVLGTEVRNRSGQKIGDLKDLVVDNQGKLTLAIVSTGSFLGLSDRLHAVPWEALRSGDDGERVLDMERAQLSRVPGFGERSWPDFSNETWAQENRRHFGL